MNGHGLLFACLALSFSALAQTNTGGSVSSTPAEMQHLVGIIQVGGPDAPTAARQLLRWDTNAAVSAIIQGARACTNADLRRLLVIPLLDPNLAGVTDFLREELHDGPGIGSRVMAAFGLWLRGETDAVPAMIVEWKKLGARRQPDDYAEREVLRFLTMCDSPDAIAALRADLRQRPLAIRWQAVEMIGNWGAAGSARPLSLPTLNAIEETLISELADTQEYAGMAWSREGRHLQDPRISDAACYYLAKRWPDRFHFDASASLLVRDRQRLECLNAWRAGRQLSPIPMPSPRSPTVGPAEATKVTAIEWADGSMQPTNALAQHLEALKGKPLQTTNFITLLMEFAADPQPAGAGLELKAIKDEDMTGVRILVRFFPIHTPSPDLLWWRGQRVTLGPEDLLGTYSKATLESCAKPDAWKPLAQDIPRALAAPPATPFIISARIAPGLE